MVNTSSIRKIFGFGIILWAILYSSGLATTYYVKPDGNDALSGTSLATAWQHVNKACQVAQAGDTVFIRAGTYNESSGLTCWPGPKDCGTLYPRNNGTPGSPIVFKGYPGGPLPVMEGNNGSRYAVSLNGKSYIVLDSLEVKRGFRGIMACGHDLVVRNCVSDSNSGPPYNNTGGVCILFNGGGTAYNILIENCTFFHNYDPIGGPNCSGIHIYSAESCTLRNNTIHDQTIGIYIKGNTVGNGGYNDSIYIHDNIIHEVGSGIEVHGQGTMRDIFVYNNIIYNFTEDGLSQSIGSPDGQVTGCVFYNNVVDGGGGNNRGFAVRFGTDSTRLYNNIFYNCGDNGGDYRREIGVKGEEPATHFMEDYDCVWDDDDNVLYYWLGSNWTLSQWRANTGNGAQTISQDPLFVDPANHDYRLLPNSPCRGTGLGGVDMGAYPSPSSDTIPPTIFDVGSSNLTHNSATIGWTTDESATSQVEYGLSTSYGLSTTFDPNLVTTHSQTLTGLLSSTLYHYRVRSMDEIGNESISSDYTFTTLAPPDTTPPLISNVGVTEITRHEATISWNTDEVATSFVEYGLTPSYSSSTNLDTNLVTSHSQRLTELYPSTLYHYRVTSKDGTDNEATSQDCTFSTAPKPGSPHLINPPDDTTLGEPNPDLVILNGIDSLGFELVHLFQIDTTTDFNSPNLQESSPFVLNYVDDSTTLWTVPQELDVGTYRWRAYAYTNTFPSDTSDPSETFTFRTTYTDVMDTAFQLALEYPLQNDTVPTLRPTLMARLVSGGPEINLLSCQFEISEDPRFSNNVLSSGRITFSEDRTARWEVTPDLKQNSAFYWRAKLYLQNRLLDVTQTSTIFTGVIHVFPNPFKPSLGHSHVTFCNIPLNSTIRVTTISGDLVKTFDNVQQTDVVWDVKSEDQKELASGVYLYWVSHAGKVSSGKIFVIR